MILLKNQNLRLNFLDDNLTIKCLVSSVNLNHNFKSTHLTTFNAKNKVKGQGQTFILRKIFLQKEIVLNKTN